MKNEKLNVDRCWNANEADVDDLGCHRWRALPYIEMTEHGPIVWHICERCPARALHDPETEDGFEEEPVVVYPPSCFEIVVCTCEGPPLGYHARGDRHCLNGCGCPAKASGDLVHHESCTQFQANAEAIARAEAQELPSIPGAEMSFTASLPRYPDRIELQPEAAIVHPPTDPAPPSEELKRAMAEEGFPWDDPPTLKRPTPVPACECGD